MFQMYFTSSSNLDEEKKTFASRRSDDGSKAIPKWIPSYLRKMNCVFNERIQTLCTDFPRIHVYYLASHLNKL